MDRSELLDHLKNTRFAPGDREAALADARKIAAFLKKSFHAEVYGVGSLFESPRPFRVDSDIDLVVSGIPPDRFLRAASQADDMSRFEINLIPLETANDLMVGIVESRGVEL